MAIWEISDGIISKIKEHINKGHTHITSRKQYLYYAAREQMERDKHPEINRPKIITKVIHNPNSSITKKDLFILSGIVSAVVVISMILATIIATS